MAVGAVMVADDLALIADSAHSMQAALTTAEREAARERYKFNTDKTKVVAVNTRKDPLLLLNGSPLALSDREVHLGIHRNSPGTNKNTMEERVKGARRAAYSLMGAGMHGLNGVGPEVAFIQYSVYITPTLLYGLDALIIGKTDLSTLESFYRKDLRYIQHLPPSTAIPAVYLLLGAAPAEAMLDVKVLTLFRNIIAADNKCPSACYIQDLINRQLATAEDCSRNWTSHVTRLLKKYDLPTAYQVSSNPPTKQHWKRTVKSAVYGTWDKDLREEASSKSTMQYLDLDHCRIGRLHPVWKELSSPLDIQKATVKAQLLVKRYPLATSPTSGARRLMICPLCGEEDETTEHFVLTCQTLRDVRTPYLLHILETCRSRSISVDLISLTSMIMDSSKLSNHELHTRNFLFKLHITRSKLLGAAWGYKAGT
jgi:hypothetical protein